MDIAVLLPLLFLIGLVASFLGNFISGGSSLIALTAMLFIGVPPHIAISTFAVGAIAWSLGGMKIFHIAGKIVWKLVPTLSVLSIIGAFIGANILLATDEQVLNKIIGFILLLFIPLSLIKKDFGLKRKDVSNAKKYVGLFIYFLLNIWSGFLAAGVGIFYIYIYIWFFGLTILEAKGTSKIPVMTAYLSVAIALIASGAWEPLYLAVFVPAMFIGSSLGAKYAIKIGDEKLRLIILITVAIMSLNLILR